MDRNTVIWIPAVLWMVLILPFTSKGQFEEHFDDGDFDHPLEWKGDRDQFIVNAEGQLQLDADAAGEALLYLETSFPDSAIWKMQWLLDFAPSNSNYLRIYLQLDSPDLSLANGYFIEVGENGSDDKISLFRLENGTESLLTNLEEGSQSGDPAIAFFIASRNPEGQWKLQANYEGQAVPTDEIQWTDPDPLLQQDGYFGIHCTFTSQRVDKFTFDDISLKKWTPDTDAPAWQSLDIEDAQRLIVRFDEAIDSLDKASITLLPDQEIPSTALILPGQSNAVELEFSQPLINGSSYVLVLNGLFDAEGNEVQNDSIPFEYLVPVEPAAYEVLIHEIMFEPREGEILPDAEYIELYNPTNTQLTLEGLRLSDEANETILPEYQMPAHTYLILTDDDDAVAFESLGPVLGIPSFPQLNNSGDVVRLKNPLGDVLHKIRFDESTYGDATKSGKGWSIEMVNPLDPCAGEANWTACIAVQRGTPGQVNSVTDTNSPPQVPELTGIYPLDPERVELSWSKGMDGVRSHNPDHYAISPDRTITEIQFGAERNTLLLFVEPALEEGVEYTLTLRAEIADCAGHALETPISKSFGIPETPSPGDVVLNEILFDPEVGGEPFIELLNASEFYMDFENLYITYDDGFEIESLRFPETFSAPASAAVVLSPSPPDIESRYIVAHPQWLFKADLPSLDQNMGIFRIYSQAGGTLVLLDSARYEAAFHAPFLQETEGVSLERIRATENGFSEDNWYSAAETAGYASPTGPNSQSHAPTESGESKFNLASKTFSPDGDGHEDQLIMEYSLDRSGYKLTANIYDRNGYLIRHWIRNQSLGQQGYLRWNGADDEAGKAPIGMYIIRIELWHPEGDREVIRKVCAVASRFD